MCGTPSESRFGQRIEPVRIPGLVPEMAEQERAVFDALAAYRKSGYSGYFAALAARPQAVGYGLTDSPAGLAAFFLWHPGFAQWTYGEDPEEPKTKTTCWTTSR